MKILLVHQNYPGQFRDIGPELCNRGHDLKAIGSSKRENDSRIEVIRYDYKKENSSGIHENSREVDEWIKRGELVGEKAKLLKESGWTPDVVLAHPGWGEALLLREIFPSSPLIIWPELWLKAEHLGQYKQKLSIKQMLYLRIKDWLIDGAMADAKIAILPTKYQAETFPIKWRHKIRVIHEGVKNKLMTNKKLEKLTIKEGVTLGKDIQVVTFISRNLEPMRGFPTFMRALPELLSRHTTVHVIIVGGDEVSYSTKPDNGENWREVMLNELEGKIDLNRVHIFGRVPHDELQKIYLRSNLHIYLSQAFVLSWSLLEVMASGTPILAQANQMMRELIEPGNNGALWDGSDPRSLALAIKELLDNPNKLKEWGEEGKRKLRPEYCQEYCIDELERLLLDQASCF